jgi:hypothetical protein
VTEPQREPRTVGDLIGATLAGVQKERPTYCGPCADGICEDLGCVLPGLCDCDGRGPNHKEK